MTTSKKRKEYGGSILFYTGLEDDIISDHILLVWTSHMTTTWPNEGWEM